MDKTTKSFWQSKTFWLGIINIAIAVLAYTQENLVAGTSFGLNGLLIIILRTITEKPISWK